MKKFIISVIAAVIAAVCLVTGCGGTYIPPEGGGGNEPSRPVRPSDDEQSSGDFTVRLIKEDGTLYTDTDGLTVSWSDGVTQPVTAEFGEDYIARTGGLDGAYRITVKGLPDKYAYDPNGNVANNQQRKIDVTVYAVTNVSGIKGSGNDIRNAKELPREGAYRIDLKSSVSETFFLFAPSGQGSYEVRSLVDIDDNEINPKYRECNGSRNGLRTTGDFIKGGGATNTFTVNFIYERSFSFDEIGGVLLFGIAGETRSGNYPLSYVFLLRRVGDYMRNDLVSTMVMPNEFEELKGKSENDILQYRLEMQNFMRGSKGLNAEFVDLHATANGLLNGDYVKFNEKDKYYHVYDPVMHTYGAVLCARITSGVLVLSDPTAERNPSMAFSEVEYAGNKALTINDNYDWNYKKTDPKYTDREPHYLNYKVFIEGFNGIAAHEDPINFPGLKEQFKAYEGVYGYADFVDKALTWNVQDKKWESDNDKAAGVYPVNEELKRFLQGYAVNASLFSDGSGVAEGKGLRAAEEDQWLFACGYFI